MTESGRFCFVLRLARLGDQVCVVRRLDVPFVMRVDNARRILFEEAYVLGLMERQRVWLSVESWRRSLLLFKYYLASKYRFSLVSILSFLRLRACKFSRNQSYTDL